MRRVAQEGQIEALQEKATSRSKPQPAQRIRTNPAGEDAAVEVGAQLALDKGRQAATVRAPLPCGGEERLEPFADDLVEEGLLGLTPPVPAERRGGRAAVMLPGRGVLERGRHARAHRKRRAFPRSTTAPWRRRR